MVRASNTNHIYLPHQDDRVAAFEDIHPVAKFHYLIIPLEHIKDGKSLKSSDLGLLRRMVEVGEKLLTDRGFDAQQAR